MGSRPSKWHRREGPTLSPGFTSHDAIELSLEVAPQLNLRAQDRLLPSICRKRLLRHNSPAKNGWGCEDRDTMSPLIKGAPKERIRFLRGCGQKMPLRVLMAAIIPGLQTEPEKMFDTGHFYGGDCGKKTAVSRFVPAFGGGAHTGHRPVIPWVSCKRSLKTLVPDVLPRPVKPYAATHKQMFSLSTGPFGEGRIKSAGGTAICCQKGGSAGHRPAKKLPKTCGSPAFAYHQPVTGSVRELALGKPTNRQGRRGFSQGAFRRPGTRG